MDRSHASAKQAQWLGVLWILLMLCALTGCGGDPGLRALRSATLLDAERQARHPLEFSGAKAVVLVFTTTDCPIANGYAPELNRLVEEFQPQGVRFWLVHVDPAVTPEQALAHAKAYKYQCPALLDPTHQLVEAVGATVTPEAAVITPGWRLAYCGRIDDRHVDFGKQRAQPDRRDLQEAVTAVLAGRDVPERRTKAVGCFIPDAGTPSS